MFVLILFIESFNFGIRVNGFNGFSRVYFAKNCHTFLPSLNANCSLPSEAI
uniref:Uncharacterized protein n=1 Tax=CrAss-like virus sp. ctYsL76 TaxID=2826826 RepID=A0A8S5QM32_9CAUD|nr:MAG TPA: hypothetical protein [CrAss-like virus sp. ctYsL76]